jgi:general secretion pathway protein H
LPADRARGFTLIELVVVLAIIGLMLGLVLPLIGRSVPGAALGTATREVRIALRNARITAITQGRAVAFQGDPAGGYWLDRRYHPLAAAAETHAGLRVAGGAPIVFFASGGSSGGRVVIDGAAGKRELAVDAVTGRARLVP